MITVVIGPPAAGKSSYVREHRKDGDLVLDFDVLAQALGSVERHDAPPPIKTATYRARQAVIDLVLDEGLDCDSWIIHSSPSDGQMERYEAAGAAVVLVDPGIDEALARATADGRPEWTEYAIRDWYRNREATKCRGGPVPEKLEVRKHFTVAKVAALNEDEGRFTALVSVFDNLDRHHEIVASGAFDASIAKFEAGGWVLPVVWSHDTWRPDSIIGEAVALRKTDAGLEVEAVLDIAESDTARTVFRHLKRGRIVEFSFSGMVERWSIVQSRDEDDGALRLEEIDLWEVGPCFKGANPDTALLSVKSRVGKDLPASPADEAAERDVEPAEQAEPLAPEPVDEPESTPDAEEAPTDPEPVGLSKSTQALLGLITIPEGVTQ